jgi:hypothetical protein
MSPQFVRQIVKMTPHSTDTGSFCNLYLTQIYLDTLGWLIAFNSTGRLEEVFQYSIDTDPRSQDDRSHEIRTYGFAVPSHAFHCSWWGSSFTFFYLVLRSSPFLEIRDTLRITKEDVWTSSIVGVGGTIDAFRSWTHVRQSTEREFSSPSCSVPASIPLPAGFVGIHFQWTRHSSSFHPSQVEVSSCAVLDLRMF